MEESLDELPDFLKYDIFFHESIVKSCDNSVLITAFEAISEYHKYSQVFSSTYEECEEYSLKFHKNILKALQKKGTKQAVKSLAAHFNNMLEIID